MYVITKFDIQTYFVKNYVNITYLGAYTLEDKSLYRLSYGA